MLDVPNLFKASIMAGRGFLTPPGKGTSSAPDPVRPSYVVPIRSLGTNHKPRIASHLLSLSDDDRYLRFGYLAQDAQIERYVSELNFERDEIFGIYNRKLELIAMAHLAYAGDPCYGSCAEFGVSVSASARGRGYGARLFERAAMHAANDGISLLFIHALSENEAMLKIARNAGARVERAGAESEAYLQLPPSSMETQVIEVLEQSVAMTDYRIKVRAHQFWRFLQEVQAIRQSAIDAQRQVPP